MTISDWFLVFLLSAGVLASLPPYLSLVFWMAGWGWAAGSMRGMAQVLQQQSAERKRKYTNETPRG